MSTRVDEGREAITFKIDNDELVELKYYLYPTYEILYQLQNSSFKGAAIYNDLELIMYNYKQPLEYKLNFIRLDQKVISYNIGIDLPSQKSYLLTTIKLKLKQLIEGGFFNHWMDNYLTHQSLFEEQFEDDKVVLTIDHLSVEFLLWLAFLLISLLVLIAELLRFTIFNYIRAMLFETIFRSFLKSAFNH